MRWRGSNMPNEQPTNGSTNGRSNGADSADQAPNLTTRQGLPVYDNQNNRTVGDRGPTLLENYHFLEKIAHFELRGLRHCRWR
jgi:catalase